MKIAVQKNHLWGQICTDVWTLLEKRRQNGFKFIFYTINRIFVQSGIGSSHFDDSF